MSAPAMILGVEHAIACESVKRVERRGLAAGQIGRRFIFMPQAPVHAIGSDQRTACGLDASLMRKPDGVFESTNPDLLCPACRVSVGL